MVVLVKCGARWIGCNGPSTKTHARTYQEVGRSDVFEKIITKNLLKELIVAISIIYGIG